MKPGAVITTTPGLWSAGEGHDCPLRAGVIYHVESLLEYEGDRCLTLFEHPFAVFEAVGFKPAPANDPSPQAERAA